MSEKKLRIMSGILLVISVIIFGIFQYKEKVGKDQSGPVFSVESDTITISVKDDESALMSGITASDAKDGDLTSSIFIEDVSAFTEKKARVVTYGVADSDGHVASARRQLLYSDYTPPRFELSGPLQFPKNSSNLLSGIRAEDCIDGDLTKKVRILYEEEIASNNTGENSATFKVTNSVGDASYLPVIIEFYDSEVFYSRPQLTLTDYIVYLQKGTVFDAGSYLKSVVIDGKEYTFVEKDGTYGGDGLPEEAAENTIDYSHAVIESDVDTTAAGNYVVKYSVSDPQYNTGTGTVRLYVVVTEGGVN